MILFRIFSILGTFFFALHSVVKAGATIYRTVRMVF